MADMISGPGSTGCGSAVAAMAVHRLPAVRRQAPYRDCMDSDHGGRHQAGSRGGIEDYVRLACTSGEPASAIRPRRLSITSRAAITLGAVLLVVALVLAARTVLTAPGMRAQAQAAVSVAATGTDDLRAGGTRASATPAALTPQDPLHQAAGAGQVVIHVAGEVRQPGVIRLPEGARVADAIQAAGGATQDADTERLNLARPVGDGEQVRVPRQGEDVSQWIGSGGGEENSAADRSAGSSGRGTDASGKVSLNRASAAELETLPGIGTALAGRIVDHRQANGPFTSIDQLTSVPGIGQAKVEALRDQVTL